LYSLLPPQIFVERCRRWARLADAVEHHPDRDALFQAMQQIDQLYWLERQELVAAAHVNALSQGSLERERLRGVIVEQQERLDQALTAMVTPPTAAGAEIFH
jgi:hypothetical protein